MSRTSSMPQLVGVLALTGLTVGLCDAAETSYPVKPVRLIVPIGTGGANDTVARMLSERLFIELGQPIIVENRPGAAANIGTELVVRAPADGYTLLVGSSSAAANVTLYPKLPFDPQKDLEPVSMLAHTAMMLAVHPAVPARSVKQVIALAKSRSSELTYASGGIGGPTHLAGALFNVMAGVEIVHVPYKSGGEATISVLSGHTTMAFSGTISTLPHIRSGRLRGIGVSSITRVEAAPDIPTIAEDGLPGFRMLGWIALFAPSGTPREVINRLNAATLRAFAAPDAKKRLSELGATVATGSPATLSDELRRDIALYSKLIKSTGIKAD